MIAKIPISQSRDGRSGPMQPCLSAGFRSRYTTSSSQSGAQIYIGDPATKIWAGWARVRLVHG